MPFLLLLLLTSVCLVDPWPAPLVRLAPPDADGSAIALSTLLTWATLVGQTILAAALARWTVTRLLLFPGDREKIIRRHSQLRFGLSILLLVGYKASLWVWGWGWAVQTLCTVTTASGPLPLPGAELLTLAPLLCGMVFSWVCLFDADQALHASAPALGRDEFFSTRWDYVVFQVRQNLALIFVPLFLLIVERGLTRFFPGVHEDHRFPLLAVVVIAAVFIGLPWVLRLILGLRPLPDSPLRDRLLAASRRLRFRCTDILRWDTRGVVANAMVVGLLPCPRYVILTDKLIAELTPDEVEAVFGHEVGHIRHRHMLYYLVFLLLSLAALVGLWDLSVQSVQTFLAAGAAPVPAAPRLDEALLANGPRILPFVAVLGTYIFVVFGFLSRRCERQADLFGCRTVSCGRGDCAGHYTDEASLPRGDGLCPTGIRTFISALDKVAFLNGISRDKPGWLQSWQHSTIARRVQFLFDVLQKPHLERHFQRTVFLVKSGLFLALLGVAAGAWTLILYAGR